MKDKDPGKHFMISEKHGAFRRHGIRRTPPFGFSRVIIYFIIISLIVLVGAMVLYFL